MPQKKKWSLLWFVDSSMPLAWMMNKEQNLFLLLDWVWVRRGSECLYHHATLLHLLMPEPLGGQQSCKKTATSPSNPSPHKPLPQMRWWGELIGLKACHHSSKQLTMLMLFVGLLMLRRVVDSIWKYDSNVSSATGENCLLQSTCLHYKVNKNTILHLL